MKSKLTHNAHNFSFTFFSEKGQLLITYISLVIKVHINYSGRTNNDKIEDIFGLLLTLTLIGYGTYYAYRMLTDVVDIIIRRKFVINKALDFLLSPNFCIQKNYIVMMDN